MTIEIEDLEKKSTIQISDELRNRLKYLGRKGESYQDVIWRLIDKDRRDGGCYKIGELRKLEENDAVDWIIGPLHKNIQTLGECIDLEDENSEIDTEDLRKLIREGIEPLIDDLDDFAEEHGLKPMKPIHER